MQSQDSNLVRPVIQVKYDHAGYISVILTLNSITFISPKIHFMI